MFPALIISLGSIFYPLAPKKYCPMHGPMQLLLHFISHIVIFHRQTYENYPLVFYLFLCKINRTLLDFVVSKVSTLLVPQLIFVCLYGVLLCLIRIQQRKTLLFVAETGVANGRSYQKFMQDLCALLHNQGRHCFGLCTNSCLVTSKYINAILFPFCKKKFPEIYQR